MLTELIEPFLLATFVVVFVWFFPMWWSASPRIKHHFKNSPYRPVIRASIVFQSIFVAILFIGFLTRFLAPDSVVGQLVERGGWFGFSLFVIALQYIVGRVGTAYSHYKFVGLIRTAMLQRSVDPWTGGLTYDDALPAGQAYSLEIFNDDITSMEFVVGVLHSCFNMDEGSAYYAMMDIHKGESCRAGRMTNETALLLVKHIKQQAEKYNYPFRCEVVLFASK